MSIKISKLPQVTSAGSSDSLIIVQNGVTKRISKQSFLDSLQSKVRSTGDQLRTLQSKVSKTSLDKTNPTLSKPLSTKNPVHPSHATTKSYVDNQVNHRVKIDGSSKIVSPLLYDGDFIFKDKNLITKEYADSLLDVALKTVKSLPGNSYPNASAGDVFISVKEYDIFAEDGPALQKGDLLICLTDSAGGAYGAAGSQFAILNTNVVLASEDEAGILKIATDEEARNFSSDITALTPKKFKDSLTESSLYNRTLIDRTTYIVVEEDKGILAVDNRRSACTITLPSVTSLKNPNMFKITIKDEFGQADLRNITIKASGATIDSKTQTILSNKYQAVTIYNDGKNYYVENNTHATDEISERLMQAGKVYPAGTGSAETMYSFDIDLSQFDVNQGFSFEVGGQFANNGNTKTVILDVGGNTTVTNATTTAPNDDHFVAKVTILKAARLAVGHGYMLLEAIAADTFATTTLDLDWSSTITVSVTANCATTATDISILSAILEPLK